MAKLLGTEKIGDRTEYHWLHTGDDHTDRITIQTTQDVDPIIADVARRRDAPVDRKAPLRFKASIPVTLVEEASRIKAAEWGVRVVDAYREIVAGRTDRANAVWRTLTEGCDYSKFQANGR